MTLRADLFRAGFRPNEDGDWVSPDGVVKYGKEVVDADDAILKSRERTGKMFFEVYAEALIFGAEEGLVVVPATATEDDVREAIKAKHTQVWKVYEVDESRQHSLRWW